MVQKLRLVLLVPLALLAVLACGVATAAAAPANDNFAARQTITGSLPITVAANNIGATAEAGEPAIYSNDALKSVWFAWTAPATANVVIDQCKAGFTGDPNPFLDMAVRTGTTLGSLVLVQESAGRCLLRFHATAGTTYNFQIDYRSSEGNFNLKLRAQAPPANDNFAGATVIGPNLPVTQNGTTVDSTWEPGEPASLGGSTQSRSVWYSWTAPTTARVRLSLCDKTLVDGPLNDMTIVYTGASLAALVPVATLTSSDCNMDFPVTAGTTYRIAVSGYIIGDFDFVLNLKAAPLPGNDDFANAQTIGPNLPLKATGNNDFATEEAGEPNHGGYPDTSRSVWFKWTAGVSGPVRLKACSRDLSFFTSVYTGTTLATLTEVGERFNYAPCSNFFDAVAGTTYSIAVAGGPFDGTHGPFDLDLRRVQVPANDAFTSAINLGSGVTVQRNGTTVDATTEENEPDHTGSYSSGYGGSVWYRWKAPSDNAVILQACSPTEPNLLAVYRQDPEAEGPLPRSLHRIDSDSEDCRGATKGGRLAIAPVKGTTYFIAVVAAKADYESPFSLQIQTTAGKPAGFNLKQAIAKCKKLKGKKRARCIKAAKKKAALLKCKKLEGKARTQCIKSAKRRFR